MTLICRHHTVCASQIPPNGLPYFQLAIVAGSGLITPFIQYVNRSYRLAAPHTNALWRLLLASRL